MMRSAAPFAENLRDLSLIHICIFVIDQGGILEQGSPAELMKKKGAYYDLYMAQFAGLE